ncbi:hypothetical protein JZX87_09850 [Agrobacterium sp. Ap1]|uniref:hypothetical protein n=1 Tax=Agrobacterium sp. Ap1 TaxID=2815337 RepID=UPI001A909A1C|nr:hypothetical protein [Agrobacterium sp. Ap1]MBO0141465.1 hypothetical protein [Agrobacterium sp. Ap1]
MSVVHSTRQASVDEIAAEMDRRGTVIESLEADRNLFKGKYRSMAALMETARSQIRQISDHTENEGDRAYFGSTNHADYLQDLAEDMEGWCIDFELPKGDINKMERDPYAMIREQRNRADKAEAALAAKDAEIAALKAALEPFADAAENLDDDHKDSSPIWEAPAAMSIDAKHLRAARAALKEKADV